MSSPVNEAKRVAAIWKDVAWCCKRLGPPSPTHFGSERELAAAVLFIPLISQLFSHHRNTPLPHLRHLLAANGSSRQPLPFQSISCRNLQLVGACGIPFFLSSLPIDASLWNLTTAHIITYSVSLWLYSLHLIFGSWSCRMVWRNGGAMDFIVMDIVYIENRYS